MNLTLLATNDKRVVPFKYQVGCFYKTQTGDIVQVLERTTRRGHECLKCSDGRFRYDRSTTSADAGRVTGTAHDYSYEHNFERYGQDWK